MMSLLVLMCGSHSPHVVKINKLLGCASLLFSDQRWDCKVLGQVPHALANITAGKRETALKSWTEAPSHFSMVLKDMTVSLE